MFHFCRHHKNQFLVCKIRTSRVTKLITCPIIIMCQYVIALYQFLLSYYNVILDSALQISLSLPRNSIKIGKKFVTNYVQILPLQIGATSTTNWKIVRFYKSGRVYYKFRQVLQPIKTETTQLFFHSMEKVLFSKRTLKIILRRMQADRINNPNVDFGLTKSYLLI